MLNLVAINLKNRDGELSDKCSIHKCVNPARYQLFPPLEEGELPDWAGNPVCSHHLVEEARHRPEIILSLLDILIEEFESRGLLTPPSGPRSGDCRVIPMRLR
jgi:hypothetical protein